ncbi:putative F-box protein At3g58820 [Panicum hallii]|uniref:putative F-box protein At3g58820 n=1 Tax=Panicum hallii TaxID=206008 RepID=UPI000DF4EC06|nr:putative F-box protein At3g58820 [Panicum hallii]
MRPLGKKAKSTAPSSPATTGIDVVPDGVLKHILGFLPSPEAVRMCVLARRWRHLRRHATGLRVSCLAGGEVGRAGSPSPKRIRDFVDRILLLRGHAPLETFELRFWCPSLQYLVIESCEMWDADKVSSESLKHWRMTSCIFSKDSSTVIHARSLVSLRLDGHLYRAPVLEIMPSFQEAFVRVIHENLDSGYSDDYSGACDDEDCYSCYGAVDGNYKCVLLEGLSEAENLALISESKASIYERDLKQCPTFSRLKTLLLNDRWCVAPAFPALTCILKHSPVLEKLTLHLFSKGPGHKMEMIGRYNPTDKTAAIPEHLKEVQVEWKWLMRKFTKFSSFFVHLTYSIVPYA